MKLLEIIVMTSMNFPTLPYNHVTNSFLLEICFWGPNYLTFLYDVTLFSLFFLTLPLVIWYANGLSYLYRMTDYLDDGPLFCHI